MGSLDSLFDELEPSMGLNPTAARGHKAHEPFWQAHENKMQIYKRKVKNVQI